MNIVAVARGLRFWKTLGIPVVRVSASDRVKEIYFTHQSAGS